MFQREGCQALTVVSMPFFWPPRADAVWEGQPLPTVQSPQYTPTFGTLAAAGAEPITQE